MGGGHHATPPGGPFARLEQHTCADLPGTLRLPVDLVDLDVGEPNRPRAAAFDDPAAGRGQE